MSMHAYIESNLNGTRSLRIPSLCRLHFVSLAEVTRDDRAACADNPQDHTYHNAQEELKILRECPRVNLRLMELLSVIFCLRDITQPINELVGGVLWCVAHRHRDFPRVFIISHGLVDLLHYLRDLYARSIIIRGLRGARKTQLNRASRIARLVGVPRQTYQGYSVKSSFQEFRIGTMTQHHSGSAVTCNNEATVLRERKCLHAIAILACRVIIQFNGALESSHSRGTYFNYAQVNAYIHCFHLL